MRQRENTLRNRKLVEFPVAAADNAELSELYKTIAENTSAAQFIIDGNRFIYVNPAFENLTGFTEEELCSFSASDFLSYDHAAFAETTAANSTKSIHEPFQTKIKRKDGESRTLAVTIAPVRVALRPALLGTVNDITHYRLREESLKRRALMFRMVFKLAPDLIMIYRQDGTALDINPIGAEILGFRRDEDSWRAGVLEAITRKYKSEFEMIREGTLKEGSWFGELDTLRLDGERIIVEMRTTLAELWGEKYLIMIARDMTERKKMEEQILAGLREKENLLREINHRVKNNLQIILSLLRLQSRNSANETTKGILRESQNRILSMAMIHEKLYRSEGLHRIDFSNYINDLAREVLASFGKDAKNCVLKTEIEDITLGLNTAIPCGLVIIELLSNALKYAFPDGSSGEVFIGLHNHGSDGFRLTVRDNGIGIPEGLNIADLESLGLRLVSDLVRYQLGGELEISRNRGTIFHVAFKETRGFSK
ncbi:MAG: sensor histidine kinase [Syntrophobacteraceae bacterium]